VFNSVIYNSGNWTSIVLVSLLYIYQNIYQMAYAEKISKAQVYSL